MHSMIVEVGRDGYEMELFDEGKRSIETGMFIDASGGKRNYFCQEEKQSVRLGGR